jgi:hypothetical protein
MSTAMEPMHCQLFATVPKHAFNDGIYVNRLATVAVPLARFHFGYVTSPYIFYYVENLHTMISTYVGDLVPAKLP